MDRILEKGAAGGLEALTGAERHVWLIAEAEAICAVEGMDSFLEQYGPHLAETALAFERVGATSIAAALRAEDWERATRLIASRAGYDEEAMRRGLLGGR